MHSPPLLPHGEAHEAEKPEGGELEPEVVPGGGAQVVQQAAFHGAETGEAVVGVQQEVDGEDAEQVEVCKEDGAPHVLAS